MDGLMANGGVSVAFGFLAVFMVFIFVAVVVASFVAVVVLVFRTIGGVLRALFGAPRPRPSVEKRPRRRSGYRPESSQGGARRRCSNALCKYENYLSAVYCGRCGGRL